LDRVIAAAQEVARGKFGQTVTAETGDEVEELARQFNLMSAQLETSYSRLEAQLNRRTRELMALNEIAAVVSRSRQLEEVLQVALSETLSVTGLDAAGIYLLRDERKQSVRQPTPPPVLKLVAHQGLAPEMVQAIDNLAVGEGFSGRVVVEDRPLIVHNLRDDERLTRPLAGDTRLQALASFPLRASGKVLGTLFVLAPEGHIFSPEDVELLASIGHQVGSAVQNARLLQRVQEAATQEERQRLARELHDAVTQTLFSASLISDVLPRIWARSPELGAERLEELRELNRGALAEMRTLLLELRPATLTESSLPELVRQLRDAAIGRQRLAVDLDLNGEPWTLPPEVQIAFYRIAQEALNNVSKHAQAEQVFVRLHYGEDTVSLAVADDGRGFTVGDARPDSLGLSIMRERAAQIGADLVADSEPGEGTCISVSWRRNEKHPHDD
jgi:signal transduction histidine kinase